MKIEQEHTPLYAQVQAALAADISTGILPPVVSSHPKNNWSKGSMSAARLSVRLLKT